jgi:hypothetical protein
MGDASVNIGLGDSLPYLEQRFLQLLGKDEASKAAADWFKTLQTTAIAQSERVYCVGMDHPLPFNSIYQPTRLKVKRPPKPKAESSVPDGKLNRSSERAQTLEAKTITVEEFLKEDQNAVIYAGPKTTFLHHIFQRLVRDRDVLPMLITLRRPTAVDDLEAFVATASKIKKKQSKSTILLLIDGYDELSVKYRHQVSDAILRYQALGVGKYYLTCREYYDVYLLAAPEARIDAFNKEDKYGFVRAFLGAFNSPLIAENVVDDFESRGFSDFLSHPLLIALACIVKTSNSSIQPRSAIRLLERALDVLCYRWDEQKGINRQQLTPLDGKDRLRVLKRIAFAAKSTHLSQQRAEEHARKELDLLTFEKVDARQVLMETARFYGILVPSDDGWEFVQRTIQDFLAAQYWVETGEFARVTRHEWNTRTAYAACRMRDSAPILEKALSSANGLPTVTEILSNAPSFDMKRVADAIIWHFSKHEKISNFSTPRRLTGKLQSDFIRLGSSGFLNFMVETCSARRGDVTDLIAGYCLLELHSRGQKLDSVTYEKALSAYGFDRFTFELQGVGEVQLGFLKPIRE